MAPIESKWKLVSEYIYETFPIFKIKKSTLINPRTEKPRDFFLIDGLDWVNVIALTPHNEVVLIHQVRHGSQTVTTEIPGGCVDAGEAPLTAGLRELKEESGYTAPHAELLGWCHPNPAMLSNRCWFYLARNAELTDPQSLDSGEDIRVSTAPLEDVMKMIPGGQITHALTIAAFSYLILSPLNEQNSGEQASKV